MFWYLRVWTVPLSSGRDAGPTWVVWWLFWVCVFGWPLRLPVGHTGQWVAELCWLALIVLTGPALVALGRVLQNRPGLGHSGTRVRH